MNLLEFLKMAIKKGDVGIGKDGVSIKQKRLVLEKIFEKAVWKIRKFANDADYKAGRFFEEVSFDGNLLVNEGINEMWKLVCGTGGTQYNNSNARLIVGTGTGTADPSDTEATFTNGVKKAMDTSYPTYGTNQKATWKATYGPNDANQAWNEFGVLNAATSGKLMNRKVSAQGTKTSGKCFASLKSLLINGRNLFEIILSKQIEKIKNSIGQLQRLSEVSFALAK